MQASAWTSLCRLYTDTRAHAHIRHMQPIVHSQPKALAMDTMAVPRAHLFISLICWVPQIMLILPQVHKWGHFLRSERLKTFTLSAMCCCPSFFLFYTRALRFQPNRHKVHRTWRIVPRACQVKHFGRQTKLRRSSSNCPNQVREVKIHPIKNELNSPNFFQVHWTPQTKFTKQKFIQLTTGLYQAYSVLYKTLNWANSVLYKTLNWANRVLYKTLNWANGV